MSKKLYVGNLPFTTTDADLQAMFQEVGPVASARVITDRESGRSKGFGFVEMTTDGDAATAISKLNGSDYNGRPMTVSEARPQEPRSFGGGGGGGGRGGFGGGGGRGDRGDRGGGGFRGRR